MRKTMTVT